jgi:3-oxoacyl-[acyl-carrier protein] reductase
MELGLDGKVAVVAGSSRGAGLGIARQLAAEGCKVAVNGRDEASLVDAVDEVRRAGAGDAIAVAADVKTTDGAQRLVREAREQLGPVDILVINMGEPKWGRFEDYDRSDWDDSFLEIKANADLVWEVIPDMKAKHWGRIISLGSHCAKEPHLEVPLIGGNVVRSGLVALHKTLSWELGTWGITVNTIAVGSIQTGRLDHWRSWMADYEARTGEQLAHVYDGTRRKNTLGRTGSPDEMGWVVTFLASERSSFITGASIDVSGGATKALFG